MFSDEMLGAYLDGELEPEQRALVERHLAANASLAERLAQLRRSDDLLRRALPQQLSPPSDPIVAMLRGGAAAFPRKRLLIQAAALAAACAVGAIAGQAWAPDGAELGLMALSADVGRALDSTPSGESLSVAGGEVAVGFTLQGESGELCRLFELRSGKGAVESLACLEDGAWQMQVQAQAASGQGYAVAGAVSPVDAAIAAMGEVSVLERDAEQALIANGWR